MCHEGEPTHPPLHLRPELEERSLAGDLVGRMPWTAMQSGSNLLNNRGGRISEPHVSRTAPPRTTASPTWIGEDR